MPRAPGEPPFDEADEPTERSHRSTFRDAADVHPADRRSGSSPADNELAMGRYVLMGTIVGVILAVVIGWIPILGAVLTGLGIGFVARTRTRALYASFVPAIFAMAWYWLVTYLPEMPFGWAAWLTERLAAFDFIFFGASALVFAFILMGQFLFTIIAAWVGGIMMERREGRPYGAPT